MGKLQLFTITVSLTALLGMAGAAAAAEPGKGDGAKGKARETTERIRATEERSVRTMEEHSERVRDESREGAPEDAGAQRSETAQAMQERKTERKEIQTEYQEARKAGDAEAAKKKPWWKFWESNSE